MKKPLIKITDGAEPISWDNLVKNNEKIDVIVENSQLKRILKDVDNEIDKDGFIVDSCTGEREQSKDEDDIRLEEVGGLLTGSKVFIKKNIASFSEHLIEKKMRNLE